MFINAQAVTGGHEELLPLATHSQTACFRYKTMLRYYLLDCSVQSDYSEFSSHTQIMEALSVNMTGLWSSQHDLYEGARISRFIH